MANAGRGNAHYAATIEDAPGIFATEFDDLASTVAHNVSVEIRPTDAVKLLGILNDYPATEVVGGIQVQLGDTFGDEVRRLVFELHIPQLADLGECRVADVVIRYTTVGDHAELHEVTLPVTVNAVDAALASGAPGDQGVTEQVTILRAAESRRRAQRLADDGRFAEAEVELASSVDALQSLALLSAAPGELLADARQLEYSRLAMEERRWSALDRKRMHYEAHRASKSRGRDPRRRHAAEER
jgi:hypothetical protein